MRTLHHIPSRIPSWYIFLAPAIQGYYAEIPNVVTYVCICPNARLAPFATRDEVSPFTFVDSWHPGDIWLRRGRQRRGERCDACTGGSARFTASAVRLICPVSRHSTCCVSSGKLRPQHLLEQGYQVALSAHVQHDDAPGAEPVRGRDEIDGGGSSPDGAEATAKR